MKKTQNPQTLAFNFSRNILHTGPSKKNSSLKLIHEMINSGYFGINIPLKFGGKQLSLPEVTKVFINLAYGDLSATALLGSHLRVAYYICKFGTNDQKDSYLKKMAIGEIIFANCHSEGNQPVISSFTSPTFLINGTKTSVTNAQDATHLAITTNRGKNIFLLDKSTQGIKIGSNIPRNGMVHTSLCPIVFSNCLVPQSSLLGGLPDLGDTFIKATLGYILVNYAARSVGLGRSIYDMLITAINNGDLNEDKQLQSLICNIDGQLIAAELLTQQAAVEVEEDPENTRNAYHARWFGAEICHSAAIQAFDYLAREPSNIHIIERIIADASYLKVIGKRLPELKPMIGASLIHNSYKSKK